MSIAGDIVAELNTDGLGVAGADLFASVEIDDESLPAVATFVWQVSSVALVDSFAGGPVWATQLTALVRDTDFAAGQARAAAIREALHRREIAGYVSVHASQGAASYRGRQNNRHRWAVGVTAWTPTG